MTLSWLHNNEAALADLSQGLCASVYPTVIHKLYSVGTTSFMQWGERAWEENGIQMKGFFFLTLIDGQNVKSRPFLNHCRQRKASDMIPARLGTRRNRNNGRGSILVPSQVILTGSCPSRPGLLGRPGRQMEMIWAHPVWPEFDPLGKICKRKGEERSQTDPLKNCAY